MHRILKIGKDLIGKDLIKQVILLLHKICFLSKIFKVILSKIFLTVNMCHCKIRLLGRSSVPNLICPMAPAF